MFGKTNMGNKNTTKNICKIVYQIKLTSYFNILAHVYGCCLNV